MGDDSLPASSIEGLLSAHMHKTLNIGEDQVSFDVHVVEEMPKDKTGKLRSVVSLIDKP